MGTIQATQRGSICAKGEVYEKIISDFKYGSADGYRYRLRQ